MKNQSQCGVPRPVRPAARAACPALLKAAALTPVRWLWLCAVDWIPLSVGSVRPTQGRTLAVCQVNGGSQSFNTVNVLRQLGRWMRMWTVSPPSLEFAPFVCFRRL